MRGLRPWREASQAVINLLTFLFVITGFVYSIFFRSGEGLENYIDALYFTRRHGDDDRLRRHRAAGIAGKLTAISP